MELPPSLHDLAPCDFLIFPKLKSPLNNFEPLDEIQSNITVKLKKNLWKMISSNVSRVSHGHDV
jgi:hypothetical protein